MQHFQTKTEHLINALTNRLDGIKKIEQASFIFEPTKTTYEQFYFEVAFFVHLLIKDPDSQKLYFHVLNYKSRLLSNQQYLEALAKINETVVNIAKELLAIPEITKLDESGNLYPTYGDEVFPIKASDLLKRWLNFDSSKTKDKAITDQNLLTGTVGVAGRMVENLLGFVKPERLETVAKLIVELRGRIDWYDYFDQFECGYHGVIAAEHLAQIYVSIHPALYTDGGFNIINLVDQIKNREAFLGRETIRTITSDCQTILNYIKERLYTQLSIESYIERFFTYIALYYAIDFTKRGEKVMQTKFEEFLFNAGYYPVSELQMKQGRLDTIAVNKNFAFLFELKQFDLNKTPENNLTDKLKEAIMQSHVYKDNLHNFPNINSNVFVLVFTNRKVIFKDGVDRWVKNGVTFIIKACIVYNETASNIKNEEVIDLLSFNKA